MKKEQIVHGVYSVFVFALPRIARNLPMSNKNPAINSKKNPLPRTGPNRKKENTKPVFIGFPVFLREFVCIRKFMLYSERKENREFP